MALCCGILMIEKYLFRVRLGILLICVWCLAVHLLLRSTIVKLTLQPFKIVQSFYNILLLFNRLHHYQRVGDSDEISGTKPHWSWIAGHDQWSWCWSKWNYWFPWVFESDGKENEGELCKLISIIAVVYSVGLGAPLVSFFCEWLSFKSLKCSSIILEFFVLNLDGCESWFPSEV